MNWGFKIALACLVWVGLCAILWVAGEIKDLKDGEALKETVALAGGAGIIGVPIGIIIGIFLT